MTATLGFVLLALVLLAVFATLASSRRREVPDLVRASAELRALDVVAFRNLVDPEEEEFLRARLPALEFKRLKRERALTALTYVKALSSASLQFARFGDLAQRSADPATAASGQRIANSAVNLRWQTLQTSVRLRLIAAFPALPTRALRPLLEQYDRANYLMLQHNGLRRAQNQSS